MKKTKFKVGDIITTTPDASSLYAQYLANIGEVYQPLFRKIVEVFNDGTYKWCYPEVPNKHFYSVDSNDIYLSHWELINTMPDVLPLISDSSSHVTIDLKTKEVIDSGDVIQGVKYSDNPKKEFKEGDILTRTKISSENAAIFLANIGEVYETRFRKIIYRFDDGTYEWCYTDVPEKTFYSSDSNDIYMSQWELFK